MRPSGPGDGEEELREPFRRASAAESRLFSKSAKSRGIDIDKDIQYDVQREPSGKKRGARLLQMSSCETATV